MTVRLGAFNFKPVFAHLAWEIVATPLNLVYE
jgi:hypothetical protein